MIEPSQEDIAAAEKAASIAQTPDVSATVLPKGDLKSKVTYLPDSRVLPQAPDAEKGILSSLMLSPIPVFTLCCEFNVDASWFHVPAHGIIFNAIVATIQKGKPLDCIPLCQDLRDAGVLDAVGGFPAVSGLWTFLPTAANAKYYLEIVHEKFILREGIRVCTEYAGRSYEEQDDVSSLLDSLEKDVLAIRKAARGSLTVSSREAAEEAMANIRWRFENPGKIRGIATGFTEFDLTTDGLIPQEFFVIAARPSEGKTALAMQMAEHIAFVLRKPVTFYSLEMSRQQFFERWIYMRAQVNPIEWRYRAPHATEIRRCEEAKDELASAPITIEEGEGLTIQSFRASARRLVRQKKADVIFVDSGSALTSTSKQAQFKAERAVSDITAGLKGAAKELNIPIVALWHLGRQVDEKEGEMPRLKDLRGGATVEQDADKIAMIVPQWQEGEEYPVDIFLPKLRAAARRSKVEMMFRPSITSFYEPQPDPTTEQPGLGI